MRPIEFMVWHQPTNRMHPVLMFNDEQVYRQLLDGETEWEKEKATDCPFNRADCVLLQFTGLFDAVGAKIWEGDVLRNDYVSTPEQVAKGEESYSTYVHVKYLHGGFCILDVYLEDERPGYRSALSNFNFLDEIRVGSRYEHPELMEFTGVYPLHPDHIRKHEPEQPILEAAL